MRLSRDWATPLTIGVFALMAGTGALMFFHAESPAQQAVHEWAGWLMVAAVLTHVAVNWPSFRRHLAARGRGLAIVGACALVLAGSFVLRPAGGEGTPTSAPAIAIGALARAPLARVAPLFGKTADEARQDLAAAGITLASADDSIAAAVGDDRGRLGAALGALARPRR